MRAEIPVARAFAEALLRRIESGFGLAALRHVHSVPPPPLSAAAVPAPARLRRAGVSSIGGVTSMRAATSAHTPTTRAPPTKRQMVWKAGVMLWRRAARKSANQALLASLGGEARGGMCSTAGGALSGERKGDECVEFP